MWTALKNINFVFRSNRILRLCSDTRRKLTHYSYNCVELRDKKVIVVKGRDTFPFLQGMICNDVRHLYLNDEDSVHLNCIFSFLLHFNGRVFVDLMLYNFDNSLKETPSKVLNEREGKEDDKIFIECDSSLTDQLFNYMKMHKLRKKVDIAVDNEYTVHCIYPNIVSSDEMLTLQPLKEIRGEYTLLTKDPRLNLLGYRLLQQGGLDLENISEKVDNELICATLKEYREHRYKLGVGEGAIDHPSGSSFALECNADFLHGVSFRKGCFVGQELTARVYHTGVIRKRLMPIRIADANKSGDLQSNDTIFSSDKKTKIGKLKNTCGQYGLALLNVEEVTKSGFTVFCKDVELKVTKPDWWPKVAQKDHIPCGRSDHEMLSNEHCNYK